MQLVEHFPSTSCQTDNHLSRALKKRSLPLQQMIFSISKYYFFVQDTVVTFWSNLIKMNWESQKISTWASIRNEVICPWLQWVCNPLVGTNKAPKTGFNPCLMLADGTLPRGCYQARSTLNKKKTNSCLVRLYFIARNLNLPVWLRAITAGPSFSSGINHQRFISTKGSRCSKPWEWKLPVSRAIQTKPVKRDRLFQHTLQPRTVTRPVSAERYQETQAFV